MKSKIYSSDYVKTTSKGQTWIPALLTLGFLMAFPVTELLMLGNWSGMNYEAAQVESLYENLWRDGFMFTGFIIIAMAALINGISGFWYLYSARKIDFYHSLPMKKKQMFLHRAYVGILYYLVPYLVMEFMAVCVGAMRGFFSLKLMKMAVVMLLFHLLLYLMLYFCVVLVICMTGNLLMGAIVLSGLFAYGPLLGELISIYQKFFFSTSYEIDYGIVGILKNQGSPLNFARSFLANYSEKDIGIMPAVLILVAFAAAGGAYFAYMKRPTENAGKSMIYPWSEVVVRFMAVIPTGLGVGLIFYMAPSPSTRVYWWIFGMAVGTILAHGIIEVLYQMDFRKFLSHRIQLVTACAAVAVCALTVKLDLTGYDTYLPAYEKLEGLSIAFGGLGHEDVPYVFSSENGDYYEIEESWRDSKLALEENVGLSQDIYRSMEHIIDMQGKVIEGEIYSVPVRYILKSGREVYRNYRIQPDEVRELLEACYNEGTLKERKYAFLKIDEKYLQWLTGLFYDGEAHALFQDDREKVSRLIKALEKDVKEADSQTMLENPCASLAFQYENLPVKADIKRLEAGINDKGYYYNNVYVYPGFKRTVALLKETGYPVSMDEVPVKYVKLTCYGEDEDGRLTDLKEEQYDSHEQIAELKKCMVPYQLSCPWMDKVNLANVTMMTEDGEDEISVSILKEKTPDFVKDFIEQADSSELYTLPEDSWDDENYEEVEEIF